MRSARTSRNALPSCWSSPVSPRSGLGVFGALDIDVSTGARSASQAEYDAFFDKVASIAWKHGAAVRGGGFCLPMIITEQQVDEAISIVKKSLAEASSH